MFKNPRDALDALRQARVLERGRDVARALTNGAEYYALKLDYEVYGVYKRSYSNRPDTAYIVSIGTHTCTCPNFEEYQDTCKHVVGLSIHLEEVEREYAMQELIDLLESAEDSQTGTDGNFWLDHP